VLSISELLYILAFDEDKGAVLKSAKQKLNYALVGAVLADLVLHNKAQINDKGRLELLDGSELKDPVMDLIIQIIQSSEKPRRLPFWISKVAEKPKKLLRQIEESLVSKGILIRDGDHFLGLAQNDANENEFSGKYQIKTNLRAGLLAGHAIDLHSLALLGLLHSSKLLCLVFTADEQRIARRWIQEAIVREALGNSNGQAIEEIDAAVSASLADA
jgi:hypothetical protein